MKIIRPIQAQDYPALHDIAIESGIGFTSLPVNEALLRSKIERSETSFQKNVSEPFDESYLFVMEDTDTGRIVGTSGIAAMVGQDDPFYHYHLGKVVHASRELDVHNAVDILTLCNDYTGVSEICTLFLRPEAREDNNGRLLSKFRFLFMQQHPERFADTVIAEMRGVSDEQGKSPFWQWLEEHFFSMDFPTADYLTGIGNKVFIAELMPKYPIYVSLLSPEAQAVIGHVHEKTKPALRLLEQEGFIFRGYVDIFDAGPTVESQVKHIHTVQRSQALPVRIDEALAQQGQDCYIINDKILGFRGCCANVWVDQDNQVACIDAQTAHALELTDGEHIRFAPV